MPRWGSSTFAAKRLTVSGDPRLGRSGRSPGARHIEHPLLPFQPDAMSPAHLAAVSFLARYSSRTHALYAFQLRRWFAWCEANGLDPLLGIQRAHVEFVHPPPGR